MMSMDTTIYLLTLRIIPIREMYSDMAVWTSKKKKEKITSDFFEVLFQISLHEQRSDRLLSYSSVYNVGDNTKASYSYLYVDPVTSHTIKISFEHNDVLSVYLTQFGHIYLIDNSDIYEPGVTPDKIQITIEDIENNTSRIEDRYAIYKD